MQQPPASRPTDDPSIVVMPGAHIDPDVSIEPGVYIGPNAVVLGNPQAPDCPTILRAGARVGGNATIFPGVVIGAKAEVAAGAVVKRSVPTLAIVEGNPANIVGYAATPEIQAPKALAHGLALPGVQPSRVRGVTFHAFREVADVRGTLTVGEFAREIPFVPKRYFMVFDVPTAETRGEHAHVRCEQFLIAVRGSLSVVVDDGTVREEYLLDRPSVGLYLPPMIWGIQYRYSADTLLLVFASELYDPDDYMRDYGDFLAAVGRERP